MTDKKKNILQDKEIETNMEICSVGVDDIFFINIVL